LASLLIKNALQLSGCFHIELSVTLLMSTYTLSSPHLPCINAQYNRRGRARQHHIWPRVGVLRWIGCPRA
jgi:hypothetical protein